MDPREALLPGSASYYLQRGMTASGTGLQGSTSILPSLSASNFPFQSSSGVSSIGASSVEPPSTLSPHRVTVSVPPGVPQSEPVRRKRGRPRKYGPDSKVSLALTPSSSNPVATLSPTHKRGRGRPPGTGRKQHIASIGGWISSSAGMGFTPHVITIAVGEDITTKIMSFSQQGPRAICILSANGAVSTVTLRQPSTSGGSVTYEGRFEILCLTGSYLLADGGGPRGRIGGLSISLASPDGRVIGGGVGGVLIAATPVQVIIGSFLCSTSKTKNKAAQSQESGDSEKQNAEDSVPPGSVQLRQNINPTTSPIWPGSRPMGMQLPHGDIDLMHG